MEKKQISIMSRSEMKETHTKVHVSGQWSMLARVAQLLQESLSSSRPLSYM